MSKVMICGYRDWAYDIFKNVELTFDGQKEIIYIDDTEDFEFVVDKNKPEIIFFLISSFDKYNSCNWLIFFKELFFINIAAISFLVILTPCDFF